MQEFLTIVGGAIVIMIGLGVGFARFYRKAGPEEALVRSGSSGLKVAAGTGMWVVPILHRVELMDLSVKRIEISRRAEAGLICQDNIRADIEVAFFVRVNNTPPDILQVAQALGCKRASDQQALVELFDAKFSEALKTVGRRFDFVELYNERDKFKEAILNVIGTDLNGYILDDCAIDYLEQTALSSLDPNNILDAQGIKKITDLTAREHILSNDITREKEKVIKKQDVEAREVILQLDRQKVEAEQKQYREIESVTAREQAEAAKVRQEEHLKAERARIATEEEVGIAEENKQRAVVVAEKNKEKTTAVETERVEKERMLEVTERLRVVGLADIEKEKMIEVEKRNIQEVIRERVMVERAVVEEQERIKDTEAFAGVDRTKRVAVTTAEKEAEEALVKEIKAAEAAEKAAGHLARQVEVDAQARLVAAEKDTDAMKRLAEGKTAEEAAIGIAEANVMTAKADAIEKHGTAEATVLQRKATAEAKGVEAMATAVEKQGTAEATVMQLKYGAEAKGIEEKAEAMKIFDGVGREHEEFKLELNKDKEIELGAISAQTDIAEAQSRIVGEALKSARIDIVGGETVFFDKIVGSIKGGKSIDRWVENSEVLSDVKDTFFNGSNTYFKKQFKGFFSQFNMSFEDVKDLSVTALIARMLSEADNDETVSGLSDLLARIKDAGLGTKKVAAVAAGLGLSSGDLQKDSGK